ncbi:hypothetical protein BH20ACI2_BH20ACI2_24690 [soil metagenome]
MTNITEAEFARIVDGIREDRESIIRHNPMGTDDEILLWMLLSCLVSYLTLTDTETPSFSGRPDATAYKNAILYILHKRMDHPFSGGAHLEELIRRED